MRGLEGRTKEKVAERGEERQKDRLWELETKGMNEGKDQKINRRIYTPNKRE